MDDFSFRLLPILFGGVVSFIYLLYTDDHLGGADSGELIATSFTMGTAHPPGYPLYIILGKLFSLLLPFANIIYAYNLFATLCSLAAFALIYRALRLCNIHPAAIITGGAFFVFSPISIRWLTTAEVFSLHLLICALGIFLTLSTIRAGRITTASRWLGLVVGLGASNHHTIIFLFPGFFTAYFYYWFKINSSRERCRELCWLLLTALPGFLFYLQPVISSWYFDPPVSAMGISVNNLQDLIDLFLRRMYGTFKLAAHSDLTLPIYFWLKRYIIGSVFSAKGLTLLIGSLVVWQIIGSFIRWRSLSDRIILLWFLGSISFFLLVDTPPQAGLKEEILARMFLMPNLMATLLAILALDHFVIKAGAVSNGKWKNSIMIILPAAATLLTVVNSAGQIPVSSQDIETHYGRDALESCTPDSILFVTGDSKTYSILYLQEVEKVRRDVTVIVWPMVGIAQYHAYLARRFGNRLGVTAPEEDNSQTMPMSVGDETDGNGLSTLEFIEVQLARGIDVFSVVPLKKMNEEGEREHAGNLFSETAHGIVRQIRKKKENGKNDPSLQEILQANIPQIEAYMSWLPSVIFSQESLTEQALYSSYVVFLREMRNSQFEITKEVIPINLLEKICLFTHSAVQTDEDPLADLFLGVFYYRFLPNQARSKYYLDTFMANYSGPDKWLYLARTIRARLN